MPYCDTPALTDMPAGSSRPQTQLVRVLLAWGRFGPYHHARARAAAARVQLAGLEISTVDRVNAWAPVKGTPAFRLHTLCDGEDANALSVGDLRSRIDRVLAAVMPDVVVVHGYDARDALILLIWALRHGRPAVLFSDSTSFDRPRSTLREWVKRRTVRLFASGLAAGTRSHDYLVGLGLKTEKIFFGCDVVDNAHFARRSPIVTSAALGIPGSYFLTIARFVEVKNLFRLLKAFASYRQRTGFAAWRLVIVGDGPLRGSLEAYIAVLGLEESVLLPGYRQYDDLPDWYSAAGCFILPSVSETWGLVVNEAMAAGLPVLVSDRCGCVADLVQEGVNGFVFDPYEVESLADLMVRMAHGDVDRELMGRASRRIISDWGPERFADGLEKAVAAALAAPPPKPTLLDNALLWALIHR